MLRIELKAAASGQPGYGELILHGWEAGTEGLELAIQRNQDGRYLDVRGGWDTNPAWHVIDGFEHNGKLLSGEVGPWLIDPLVLDPQMVYMLQLRNTEASDKGVLRTVGNLLSSQAAGNSLREEGRVNPRNKPTPVEAEPSPPPEPVVEPVTEPVVEPPPPPEPMESLTAEPREIPPVIKDPRRLVWIIALLTLLAVIGAACYWWFFLRDHSLSDNPAVDPAQVTAPATSSSEAGDCTLDGSAQDLAFIQTCLKSKPSSEQLLAVIDAAKKARRCGVVQRLYAHQAQSGNAAIAFAYAREYDPQTFKAGGCIESADAETAVYWYEIAVANDANNKEASQRLAELKKASEK
ncbi:hypothetical protein [Azomonas macrocytogenes]|uniref:Uncharacterized protein n=1 Tax=Azomonas macrocytogenes TaxID=69962 RepID=A0A839T2Y3_AZOMA|nr:hypothetical protein [Azomonas macrocytogenes]MBB3103010.1 hypothetical protein [Azomonas macrocytogenes]